MSPLLLMATMALADPPSEQFDRLFTEAGETPAAAAAEPGAVPAGGWAWPALLCGGGLVAAWQLRKRTKAGADTGMRVVQRQALGDKSALVLVEVPDAAGGTRRLLLGSSNGSLSLLNDLGLVQAGSPAEEEVLVDNLVPSAPVPLAPAALAPAEDFAKMLDSVLDERRPESAPGRYFNEEDLAPSPEQTTAQLLAELADRPPPRRATRAPTVAVAPRPTPVAAADASRPRPLRAREAASAPPRPAGIAALVKGTLPAAQPVVAVPVTVELDPEPVAPAASSAPAPRSLFLSPYVGGGTRPSPPLVPERRLVGPPLRDPRLLAAGTILGPRLATDPNDAADDEMPPTRELLDRIAAHAESSTRADGMKRRFEAITAAVGGR